MNKDMTIEGLPKPKTIGQALYGTKIYNHKTKEVGLLIKIWINKFTDEDKVYATCVDSKGVEYNIELDLITPIIEGEEINEVY